MDCFPRWIVGSNFCLKYIWILIPNYGFSGHVQAPLAGKERNDNMQRFDMCKAAKALIFARIT